MNGPSVKTGPCSRNPWEGQDVGDHLELHADRLRLLSACVVMDPETLHEHCAGYPEDIRRALGSLLIEEANRAELMRRMMNGGPRQAKA